MNKIQHLSFIEVNQVDIKSLPDALQKEIYIHSLMREKLKKLDEKDKTDYIVKLKIVDEEIMDDLMEHFEDELEHNNVIEEKVEIFTFKDGSKWRIIGKKKALELFEKNKEVFGIDRKSETESLIESKGELNNHFEFAIEYQKKKTPPKKETKSINHDEEIIKKVLDQGKTSVSRSTLRDLGFKGELNKSYIVVGKFQLKKALFSYTYYILNL